MTTKKDWREVLAEQAAVARLSAQRAIPVYRPAPPINHAVMRALAPLLKEAGPAPGTLAARWPEIVGERLAALTEPVKVTPGKGGATLTIRAPSAAAPMIQHAADHIIARVNLTGAAKIKALKIIQSGAREEKRPPSKPKALTAEQRAQLAVELQPIETPALRLALTGLGEALLVEQTPPQRAR